MAQQQQAGALGDINPPVVVRGLSGGAQAIPPIAKFNGSNYDSWAPSLKRHLIGHPDDLWELVSGESPMPDVGASDDVRRLWLKKDAVAFEKIELTMEPPQRETIRTCISAKAAWDRISEEFQQTTTLSLINLLRQFFSVVYEPTRGMQAYCTEITNLNQELVKDDINLPGILLSFVMLNGLPASLSP